MVEIPASLAAPAGADRARLVVPRLPGRAHLRTLPNGLTVCLLESRQAPLVTTALWYRAGTRDEPPGQGGIAHFLEHMMFKGSAAYGPGEVDRRTQALGGSNNAFTSHDATAYHFSFAADRWHEALLIEADRMRGLRLDPAEVTSERQVIVEEIGMYRDDPWDALELEVLGRLFGGHPYGLPVLGTPEELQGIGAVELGAFHAGYYRPDNAVLVVGGDVDERAFAAVEEAFAAIPAGSAARREQIRAVPPPGCVRLERRQGEVARLLLAFLAPPAPHPDHPALRLLVAALAGGRAARLHRRLVDERQLCLAVSTDLHDTQAPGALLVGLELLPGVEPQIAEQALLAELEEVRRGPLPEEELERARQILVADWVFGHERVHQQALTAGFALALFDLGHPVRQLERMAACDAARVREVAARYLDPARGAVLGWSLQEE
ncbi:MAG: M16 family metallopeptidase [Acidobacteriota bacterium]